MKRTLLGVVLAALLATPAVAQSRGAAPARKVKTVDIEAIDVTGDRVTGQLGPISIKEAATSSSLIRIRRDFIDLILKSAEEI